MFTRRRLLATAAAAVAVTSWVVFARAGTSTAAAPDGATIVTSVADGPHGAPTSANAYEQDLSADGRYQAFVGVSDDLVGDSDVGTTDANGITNAGIYVRDLVAGATTLVSLGSAPGEPSERVAAENGYSEYPSISADGRYIAFVTQADNIVGGPSEAERVVACDRGAPDGQGRYPRTPARDAAYPKWLHCVLVAVFDNSAGVQDRPQLDAAGDRVVWADQDPEYPYSPRVHTAALGHDGAALTVGPMDTIDGNVAEGGYVTTSQPQISADGAWIVAAATEDTEDNAETGGQPSIVEAHATPDPESESGVHWQLHRVDLAPGPASDNPRFLGSFDTGVADPDVSADGRRVVFDADDGEGFAGSYPDVYLVTVDTADFAYAERVAATSSTLVSGRPDQQTAGDGGPGDGGVPTISADGRYVAFLTDRAGMWTGPPGPLNYASCLYQRLSFAGTGSGRPAAAAPSPSASRHPGAPAGRAAPLAAPPSGGSGGSSGSSEPTRTVCQLVVRDVVQDAQRAAAGELRLPARLASAAITDDCLDGTSLPAGQACPADGDMWPPISLSADGRRVGFSSSADNLVTEDPNRETGQRQTYVRTWTPTLQADPIDFAEVLHGMCSGAPCSADRTVTLTASGFGPLTVSGFTVTGPQAADFTVVGTTCRNRTMHAGDTCTLTVRFTPGANGPRAATVTGTTADGSTVFSDPVTGTGAAQPDDPGNPAFGAAPTTLNFGSRLPLDDPATRNVTVTNAGGSPLHVTAAEVQDGSHPGASTDYTVEFGDCASVPAGGACTVSVAFVGHAVGDRGAALVLTDNAPGGTNTIALTATVPKPAIEANPAVSPPGRVTTVTGKGFAPGLTVDVGFAVGAESATGLAKSDGTFTVQLVIFPNRQQGPRTITARSDGTDAGIVVDPSVSAEGQLLIALGSVDSPQLGKRH